MIRFCVRSSLALFGCLVICAQAGETIPAENFDRLHALVKPKASEQTWERIPWLTSLWEARRQAAAAGKPILLWEMDGHPLGCT